MDVRPMIDLTIQRRRRALGGFAVGRVLPYAKRRIVGPSIFFDHIGPALGLAFGATDVVSERGAEAVERVRKLDWRPWCALGAGTVGGGPAPVRAYIVLVRP